MKLSTLLLSSAALVVAGSAYAADLPAKKGAPAAKATGCPAFGAGYFQIPGGDNCIKFSGYMAYDGNYNSTAGTYSQSADSRLRMDVKSNSELGVINGVARWNGSSSGFSMSRAFVQVGGLTAGRNASLADIAGTSAWNYGASLAGGTGVGLWYAMPVGNTTVTIGEENAVAGSTNAQKRPDVLAAISTSAGSVKVDVVGVSHEATDESGSTSANGYAILGRVGVSAGAFGAAVFGGSSSGALKYTSAIPSGYLDYDSAADTSKGSNIGAEVTAALGQGTLAIAVGQTSATDAVTGGTTKLSTLGVDYAFAVAKGFTVEPEFIATSGDSSSNVFYLNIRRDF